MTSKSKKVISFILVLLVVLSMSLATLATNATSDLLDPSKITATSSASTIKINTVANSVYGVAQMIAMAVAVIMLIVVSIKYITSAPNDKAEIKKTAIIYVVGAVVLFGASGILQIIKKFSTVLE